ncbi:hypothetical protein B0H17DRAFT_1145514 [Mycena rosella]|uniref:Uncharacterized protein n=1 Tax=Mycena rosella TaxID=1033263 RepID=A0AAD7G5T2_MYCRO|nr:hypothetical protein B0H17DRAFT_1145514 [Mycena rosella]
MSCVERASAEYLFGKKFLSTGGPEVPGPARRLCGPAILAVKQPGSRLREAERGSCMVVWLTNTGAVKHPFMVTGPCTASASYFGTPITRPINRKALLKMPQEDVEHGKDPNQKGDSEHELGSTKLWTVYISEAEKYDKALVESCRNDMGGMLIFVVDKTCRRYAPAADACTVTSNPRVPSKTVVHMKLDKVVAVLDCGLSVACHGKKPLTNGTRRQKIELVLLTFVCKSQNSVELRGLHIRTKASSGQDYDRRALCTVCETRCHSGPREPGEEIQTKDALKDQKPMVVDWKIYRLEEQ